MRSVVEELDLEQLRVQVTLIGHRAGDEVASWVERRAVDFMRVRCRCRRSEKTDDGPHHRREASEEEGRSRAVPSTPLMSARQESPLGPQCLDVTPSRDDRTCGSDSLFEPPTEGALNG